MAAAANNDVVAATALLDEGTKRGLRWDDRAFCELLTACGRASAIDLGERVHAVALQHNVVQGIQYRNSRLQMYARAASFEKAEALFAELKSSGQADTVTFNVMIHGTYLLLIRVDNDVVLCSIRHLQTA